MTRTIIRNFIVILILLGTTLAATGQNIRLEKSPDLQLATSISEEELSQIITTLEATLNEYAQAATLYDSDKKRVTEGTIDRFHELFSPTAEVMKDYAEYIPRELIPYKDYSLEVYNMFKTKGIEVQIVRAELIDIQADLSGFYTPTVIVTKKIFNTLSANGTTNVVATGKSVTQKMIFDIYKEDLDQAKIGKIAFDKDIDPPGDYTRILSIPLSFGTSNYHETLTDYWNLNQSQADINVSGGLSFSLGFELLTDRLITGKEKSDRKLAFTVGVQYASYSIKTQLDSFVLKNEGITLVAIDSVENDSQDYERKLHEAQITEKLNFGTIQLPVGIALRLVDKQKLSFYTHLRFIPSYTFIGRGNVEGSGRYDGFPVFPNYEDDVEVRLCDGLTVNPDLLKDRTGFGLYDVAGETITPLSELYVCGNQNIDEPAEPELNRLTYNLQVSPTAYIKFSDNNPAWGLMVGLDISYRFGSLLTHNPVDSRLDEPLNFNTDFEGSFLNYYTDEVSALNFGLRIGLFQKLTNEP